MGYAFISYSTKNQSMADSMKQLLTQNEIATWMAPTDIPAGSKYAQVINQAIKDCACVVLMLSDAAQSSSWVAKEIERAINYNKVIIPVQLENLVLNDEFEFYLSNNQIVAIQQFDENQDTIQKLLETICKYVTVSFSQENIIYKNAEQQHFNKAKNDTEKKFIELANKLYDALAEYRYAFQSGDKEAINKSTMLLMKTIQQLYSIYERNSNTYQDVANKAFELVEQYNLYTEQYNAFIQELNIGYSDKSNNLAQKAENEFAKLIKIVLKHLS